MVWTCYPSNRTCKTSSCRAQYGGDEADQTTTTTTTKYWHDNIKQWTELPLAKTPRLAEDKDRWRKIIKTYVVPLQPPNG